MEADLLFLISLLQVFSGRVGSIPIDNGVVGDPTIQCSSEALTVTFQTQKPFEGRVYVKGFADTPNCVGQGKGNQAPSLNLTFAQCGVQRMRQISPPGISVSATIVISFHKTFVTKVDKAYRVSCFYMEAGKTVSAELEVSMLSTGYVTNQMAMPTCKYEILSGGPTGSPLKYAKVGDMVYHKWTCESKETMFCMRVHSCNVDDGQGGKPFQVLDAKGCAIDRYVLQNLEYPADLMAGREAHVFKFADKPTLYFNCQLEISIKPPDSKACDSTRPQCPDAGTGAGAAAGLSGTGGENAGGGEMKTEPTKIGAAGPATGVTATGSAAAATEKGGKKESTPAEGEKEGRYRRRVKNSPTAASLEYLHRLNRNYNASSEFTVVGDFDLPRQQLLVLDIEESQNTDERERVGSADKRAEDDRLKYVEGRGEDETIFEQKVCVSPTMFALSLAIVFVVVAVLASISIKALLIKRAPLKLLKHYR